MKAYLRNPVHLVALVRRYSLIQLTRWVRQWEKRSLTRRKRDVLLLFGSLLVVLLANLTQQFTPTLASAKAYARANPADSAAHHHLYRNELHNRKLTPSR